MLTLVKNGILASIHMDNAKLYELLRSPPTTCFVITAQFGTRCGHATTVHVRRNEVGTSDWHIDASLPYPFTADISGIASVWKKAFGSNCLSAPLEDPIRVKLTAASTKRLFRLLLTTPTLRRLHLEHISHMMAVDCIDAVRGRGAVFASKTGYIVVFGPNGVEMLYILIMPSSSIIAIANSMVVARSDGGEDSEGWFLELLRQQSLSAAAAFCKYTWTEYLEDCEL